MNGPSVRVVVADDDAVVREALADLIDAQPGLELQATAVDHADLLALVTTTWPDVILMDYRMPGGAGASTIRRIKAFQPDIAVVVVSAFDDPIEVVNALAAGAASYLLKGSSQEELVEALYRARRGQLSLPVGLARECIHRLTGDVEHARAVEVGLRRSETTLHDLLDRSPGGVVLVGPSDQIRLANAQADRIFGRPLNAVIGEPAALLLAPWCRTEFITMLEQAHALTTDVAMPVRRELAGLRADDDEFPALVEMNPLRLGDEGLVGVFIQDLGAAGDAGLLYKRAIDACPDAILVVDEERRIRFLNPQTERLFGHRQGELMAQPLELLLPDEPAKQPDVHAAAAARMSPGEDFADAGFDGSVFMVGRRVDGAEFPADVRFGPMGDERGSTVVAVRDMSDHRRQEMLLEQSFRYLRDIDRDHQQLLKHLVRAQEDERKRISVGIHDDTLQAISAASLRVQQLRRRLVDPADLEVVNKLENTIQLSIARLRHLIFDLRPPEGDQGGLAAALNLYLGQLAPDLDMEFHVMDELTFDLHPDTQVIAYRIAQEALSNTWKHSDAAVVTVRVVGVDEGCLVVIEDDGKGYDATDSERRPGHLGLTLMQERAQIAGGWCRIESRPGFGTTVQFWIPDKIPTEARGPVAERVGGLL